ncbi:hypothetical protein L195_g024123 [Trifolium pratense]|uniref:Uncharacterized protein n=1 Tax=Trifolium pratense TaxID=57577 RepID=A0A2K3NCR8_TRIPR|nr:hypothetical protein L195_g024123 [Trifolium pratense]
MASRVLQFLKLKDLSVPNVGIIGVVDYGVGQLLHSSFGYSDNTLIGNSQINGNRIYQGKILRLGTSFD